jgi:hypothetical protein
MSCYGIGYWMTIVGKAMGKIILFDKDEELEGHNNQFFDQ